MEKQRLLSLIEFAQHTARLRINPTYDVANHNIFHWYEHEIIGLPGIHINCNEDQEEIWLTVERLFESKASLPKDQLLLQWLDCSNNPDKEPVLKSMIEIRDTHGEKVSVVRLNEHPQKQVIEEKLNRYILEEWGQWSTAEKKRRRTIKLYAELFTLKQQLEGSMTNSAIELVWGVGIGIWNTEKKFVKYPILTQLVELSLNAKKSTLEIRPRRLESRLESDIYVSLDNPRVGELEQKFKALQAEQVQTFSPFYKLTYESQLKTAATYLDSQGVYWPNKIIIDDRQLPDAGQELKVTDTWILFARPRSKSLFIHDLERLKNQLKADNYLIHGVAAEFVKEPCVEHIEVKKTNFRGFSSVDMAQCEQESGFQDLYFPLPYNEEQINIIQQLESSNGVVVQGPPGTGKTHSIANIISHYMAAGKRVLVTSMKEPALSVIKEKLPDAIKPLAIVMLTSEHEGMQQFEFAMSKIVQEIQTIDRKILAQEITEKHQMINQLHGGLASLDRNIANWAKKNISPFICDGKAVSPAEAAREVHAAIGQFEWLDDDISICVENDLSIDNQDVLVLREARRAVKNDLFYLDAILPALNDLPDVDSLLEWHGGLLRLAKIKAIIDRPNYPSLVGNSGDVLICLEQISRLFEEFDRSNRQLLTDNIAWLSSVRKILTDPTEKSKINILENLGSQIYQCMDEINSFLIEPVVLPASFDLSELLVNAVLNKSKKKAAFGLNSFWGKGKYKAILDDIRIVNRKPTNEEDWLYVHKFIMLRCRIRDLLIRWNILASQSFVPVIELTGLDQGIKAAYQFLKEYEEVKKNVLQEKEIYERVRKVLPDYQHIEEGMQDVKMVAKIKSVVNNYIEYKKLLPIRYEKNKLRSSLKQYSGEISEKIRIFVANIGLSSENKLQLQSEWSFHLSELNRILSLKYYFENIRDITAKIKEAGAPKWAEKLSRKPMVSEVDDLLPSNWQQAWRSRRLQNHLSLLNCSDQFKSLVSQRSELEKKLANTYQDIVVKRTWLQLANNATPNIRAALNAFQAAITKIGKGTGKRAIRYRRDAQHAAFLANKAVPCWIMPHYRISESLPPEFGCFDLVIIDEASQSDFNALPAIFRAKKILVVGDDKQVSPDGVGLEEEKINALMNKYLVNQVDLYIPIGNEF